MSGDLSTAFLMGDEPLIQYEITFPKKLHLLGAGIGATGGGTAISDVYSGVTETFEDHI